MTFTIDDLSEKEMAALKAEADRKGQTIEEVVRDLLLFAIYYHLSPSCS